MWDYPRPPRIGEAGERIRVVHGGVVVADSRSALRVLETSHPPAYYLPPEDVDQSLLERTSTSTVCEWKGTATYWTVQAGGRVSVDAAWSYEDPVPAFEAIRSHLAFHPAKVDECWVGGERATPQPGRLLRRLDHVPGRRALQGRARHSRLVGGRHADC